MTSDILPLGDKKTRSYVDFAPTPGIIIAAIAGERAQKRFWEFFTANIRNPNTRQAYFRAVSTFLSWCESHHLALEDIDPMMVAAYIEQHPGAAPTVKQHLAAIRMLFDWLVIGQVVPFNPASAVRGPKHVVKVGKTPVLTTEEMKTLLYSIDTSNLVGLRDRALIAVMLYSFARVSAATGMQVKDYYHQGRKSFFRLHEKGGKFHVVPAHHKAQEYLDAYVEAAGIGEEKKTPLFRSSGQGRNVNTLSDKGLCRRTALMMVKRRTAAVGLPPDICNHSFRGSGITNFLENGGTIEDAAHIAAHESTRTTSLYNRTKDEITLDQIERIRL